MTARTTTHSDPLFWATLAVLHGHRCPMSILGARLGIAALRTLAPGPERAGGRLYARYLNRTCALDGIQLATTCTLGNGNIEVDPRGEHRLVLRIDGSRRLVAARITAMALETSARFGELRGRAGSLPAEARHRLCLEGEMEAILKRLAAAPDSDLVEIELEE